MWQQFLLTNAHFALNSLAAFVMFATAWLYFDAWVGRKSFKDGFKIAGFLFLSFSFMVHAAFIETSAGIQDFLLVVARFSGYLLLLLGLLIDPLQPQPKARGGVFLVSGFKLFPVVFPVFSVLAGLLYLRRATLGFEDHLKTVALAFFVLSVSELVSLASLFRETSNIDFYNLVVVFGPLWIVEHLVLAISIFLLGFWVWRYLLKRFQSQLFMIFAVTILAIFLLTTVSFTGLLLKNLQDETLSRLGTDVRVLNFALESKKAESLSDAQVLAQNSQVQKAIKEGGKSELAKISEDFLLTKKQSSLVIVSESGEVLAKGEDRERIGDSLSNDPLVERALFGENLVSVATQDGVLAPEVRVRAAAPIKEDEKVVGAVITGMVIDDAFVEGVKKATGLEATVYGGNIVSATTLTQGGGETILGIKETNQKIVSRVLEAGEDYTGTMQILGTPYFGAFLPLGDIDNQPVGMMFVGKTQVGVLRAANRSIELTFLIAAGLLVFSIIPAFLIARYLTTQIH